MKILAALLTLTLVVAGISPASASQTQLSLSEVMHLYLNYRDGIAGNLDQFKVTQANYQQAWIRIKEKNDEIAAVSSYRCKYFLSVYAELHNEVLALMDKLASYGAQDLYEKDFMRVIRLQLLASLIPFVHSFIANDSEAGMGLLDVVHSRQTCSVVDRQEWKASTRQLGMLADASTIDLLGHPGLSQMQRVDEVLTRKIEKKERQDWHLRLISFPIGILVSILIWQLAPVLARPLMKTFLQRTPKLTRFSLLTAGYTGEMLAFKFADDHFLFVEDRIMNTHKPVVMTWDKVIEQIQTFVYSPLNSPHLYYDLISQFYSRLSALMFENLAPYQTELEETEAQWGSIDKAVQALEVAHAN